MRKPFLTAAVLGSVVATAAPALAQDYRYQPGYDTARGYDRDYDRDDYRRGYDDRGGYGYGDTTARLRQIGIRIDRNINRGTLTRTEAVALRREYNYLVSLDRRVSYGQASRWEASSLARRTALLQQRLGQYRSNNYGDLGRGGYDDDDGRRY